jgi:hypothetical protein
MARPLRVEFAGATHYVTRWNLEPQLLHDGSNSLNPSRLRR